MPNSTVLSIIGVLDPETGWFVCKGCGEPILTHNRTAGMLGYCK